MTYPAIPNGANHATVSVRAGDENAMEILQNFSAPIYDDPYREQVFKYLVDAASEFLDQVLLDNPHYDEHYITVVFRMSDQGTSVDYPVTP